MRSFFHLHLIIITLITCTFARPAMADFDAAAGYWQLLGQQKQVPQLLNLRGTRDIAILEVVGDCGGSLCSWGATRADLLFDADGNVVQWQAFLENGDDFHEFDAFLVNGELVMDYTGDFGDAVELVTAALVFRSVTEAEITALASQNGGAASGDDTIDDGGADNSVAEAGGSAGSQGGNQSNDTGPSLEEQIVTGGLIIGGLLLLNELLDNNGNGNAAQPGAAPAPAPADPDDTCGMAALQPYMNKSYTDIPAHLIKPGDRVYSNLDNITMDLRPNRLNVVYRFATNRVFKLGCY